MNTVAGIPAHPLLVHGIVVLGPLTALLAVLCALWPAARARLVWLTVALAAAVLVLTPLTTSAGSWLAGQQKSVSPVLAEHFELGSTFIYYAVALLVIALLIAGLHRYPGRLGDRRPIAGIFVAALTIVVSVLTVWAVVRIGDTGAHAVWGMSQ